MKNSSVYIVLLLFFFSLANLFPQENQNPVVALAKLSAEDPENQITSTVNGAIYDVAKITFLFLKQYSFTELEREFNKDNLQELRSICEKNGFDNVVFGKTVMTPSGEIEISLSVYDRLDDKITANKTMSVDSLLEIFTTTEKIVSSLIEGFSGIHIEYGSIVFHYNYEDTDVELLIDGTLLGKNIKEVPRMVSGDHTVVVRNAESRNTVYMEKKITLGPGEKKSVEIELPYLNTKIQKELSSINRVIAKNWYINRNAVLTAFDKATTLLDGLNIPGHRKAKSFYDDWLTDFKGKTGRTAAELGSDMLAHEYVKNYIHSDKSPSSFREENLLFAKTIISSYYTQFEKETINRFNIPQTNYSGNIQQIEGGTLHLKSSTGEGVNIKFMEKIPRNSIIFLRVKFGRIFNYSHPTAHFNLLHNGAGNRLVIMFKPEGGDGFAVVNGNFKRELLSQDTTDDIRTGKWYDLRFLLEDRNLSIFVDDNHYASIPIPAGLATSGNFVFECHNEYWVDDFGYITLNPEG